MKKAVFIFLTISLFTCQEIIVQEEEPMNLFYSSLSVCHCYNSGMSVLTGLIDTKDDSYKMLFQELRMNCLTKYGTQLFIPSSCNFPDSLQMLQDSLHLLGIDING